MKPRNREVNIFNMSLLDILCGALGAFCFLTLTLFPYYGTEKATEEKKQIEQELEKTRQELQKEKEARAKGEPPDVARLQKELDEARKELEKDKQALASAEKQAADSKARPTSTYVLLVAEWGSPQFHVDIVVEHPNPEVQKKKRVTNFNYKTFWMLSDPPAGEYRIYYKANTNKINEAIQGITCDKTSCLYLNPVQIEAFKTDVSNNLPSGIFSVRADGDVTLKKK